MTGTSLTDPVDPDDLVSAAPAATPPGGHPRPRVPVDPEDPGTWMTETITVRIDDTAWPGSLTRDEVTVIAETGTVELARLTVPGRVVRAGLAVPEVADLVCQIVRNLVNPVPVHFPPDMPNT